MRRCTFWTGFAVLLTSLLPAFAADEDGDGKKDKEAKVEAKEKLVTVAEIVARLTRVEGSQRYVTVQVPQTLVLPAGWGRWQVQVVNHDLELQAGDDLKVRVLQPPVEFDEKGRPRRYTRKELQELKGPDPKLPGYQADFDSLKPDQIVRVTVVRKKEAQARPGPRPRSKPKAKGKDNEEEPPEPEKPQVSMILILQQPIR